MTDLPIPDELRDEFLVRATVAWDYAHDPVGPWLDALVEAGGHIELRLPEFVAHNETCCERHEERWARIRSAFSIHVTHPPCLGVGYYHWTVTE